MPPPPHVFTLEPGELRYGGFARGEKGLAFTATRAFRLPPELFAEGPLGAPLRDPDAFAAEVRHAVASLEAPVPAASLVVPDEWLRLSFVETDPLPRKPRQRDEVLRWKLKRLLPFRVEDLRISATEVRTLAGQEEPQRLLVGFAIDLLLSQIEDAFAAAGVALGRITNTSLALVAGLVHAVAPREMAALVAVYPDAYSLTLFQDGEPLLYRFKARSGPEPLEMRAFRRDLRITASYVAEHFPSLPVGRFFLAAPDAEADAWAAALHEELERPPERLDFHHLPLARVETGVPWAATAALAGAASIEVS